MHIIKLSYVVYTAVYCRQTLLSISVLVAT